MENKIKIIVGSIVEDEELYAKYCVGALYDIVDRWIIIDGGSKDKTIEIVKSFDKENKITIIQQRFNEDYSHSRNAYLKSIRDYLWTPNNEDVRTYYMRVDFDECYGGNLNYLKEYMSLHSDKLGFRFHMCTFDKTHFTLNEVAPKETRANVFYYNPNIRYVNPIHEVPVFQMLGFQQPLYGSEQFDEDLGIQQVPQEVAWYCHFAYCDFDRCKKKAFNYTRRYVEQGTVSYEKLKLMERGGPGSDWWWTDHASSLKFDGAYPSVLKDAPFLQHPPHRIIFEDGTIIESKETVHA
ncbi:MAG: glycosyltransferase [Nanoarchaeota archaeon]